MIALTTPAAQCADDCGENRHKNEGVQRKEYPQQRKNFSGTRVMHTNDTKNKSRQCRKEANPKSRSSDDKFQWFLLIPDVRVFIDFWIHYNLIDMHAGKCVKYGHGIDGKPNRNNTAPRMRQAFFLRLFGFY